MYIIYHLAFIIMSSNHGFLIVPIRCAMMGSLLYNLKTFTFLVTTSFMYMYIKVHNIFDMTHDR